MAMPVVKTGQSIWKIAVTANCIRDNATVLDRKSIIWVKTRKCAIEQDMPLMLTREITKLDNPGKNLRIDALENFNL
jgi:hypothetical protein